MMSRNGSRALCILIFESLLNCLCGVAAIWIRFGPEAREVLTAGHGWLKVALSVAVVQGSFYIFDLYDFRRIRQRVTLYIRICQAMGLASIALAVIFYVFPQLILGRGVFLLGLG